MKYSRSLYGAQEIRMRTRMLVRNLKIVAKICLIGFPSGGEL